MSDSSTNPIKKTPSFLEVFLCLWAQLESNQQSPYYESKTWLRIRANVSRMLPV